MNRAHDPLPGLPGLLALAMVLVAAMAMACGHTGGVAFAELQYPRATRTVKVGTADIAYVDVGQGEHTLVLIHGLASYVPAWERNLDALAADHRVIAIDLPGFGKSTKANYAYSMEFFAKVVRGVVRELGVERPTLVGHSMGGQIAMTYALLYPDDVEALVLTSPAGLETFEDGEAKWLADVTTPAFTCSATPEAIYARHTQNFHRMPREAEFMIRDRIAVTGGSDFSDYCKAVSRSVAGMLDQPVHARIPEITAPTLVLFGDSDQLIPNPFLHGGSTERLARKAVQRFVDAKLVVLERAGHMAQFEQPEAWNAAVLAFLGRAHRAVENAERVTPVTHEDGEAVQELYAPGTDPDEAPPAPVAPAVPLAPATSPASPPTSPSPSPAPTPPAATATPAPSSDAPPEPAEDDR